MKRKKLTQITLGFLLLFTVFITACTSEKSQEETTTAFSLTIADVNQEILDAGVFEDELAAVDTSYSEMLMGIAASDYTDAVICGSSGATAEMVAVFETAGSDAAAALKEKCEAYVTRQTQSYADYKPAEVDKLNHAIIKSNGQYVILCVAKDYENAEKLISEYFK